MSYRRVLLVLSIGGFFAILSSTASKSPTLPLFAEYLGASPGEIGVIAAASTIVGIVVNVVAGTLSDIYGRRKLLLASSIFFGSAPFLYLFVTNTWELILVRVYHGIATAIFTPVAIASIADVYRERRGSAIGLFSSATMAGRLLAPTIAGTAITLYSFHGAYLLYGIIGFTAMIVLSWSKETRTRETSARARRNGFTRILDVVGDVGVVTASIMMALTYFALQSIETFLPLYMEKLKIESWLIGVTLTIELAVIAILKPYGGYLYDNVGWSKTIGIGVLASALGLIMLAYAESYLTILLSIVLFAVGVALITACIPPLVSDIAGREVHGTALGLMETIKDVGQALGPIVTGLIVSYYSYSSSFTFSAILLLLIVFLSLILKRRVRWVGLVEKA